MQPQVSKSLRPKQAAEFLGIGLSSLWRRLKEEPDFPRPRKLSQRVTFFLESELVEWRNSQAAKF
jgi:prophage regulatory protein